MADKNADKHHCYECGSEDVEYMSLYPLTPVVIPSDPPQYDVKGNLVANWKGNSAYNVCSPCYIKQREERYPGEPVPGKVYFRAELRELLEKHGVGMRF